MRWPRILGWLLALALLFLWSQIILGMAVFAIPDRAEAPQSIVLTLVTLAIGVAVPVGVFLALRAEGVFERGRSASEPADIAGASADASPSDAATDAVADAVAERIENDRTPLAEPLTEPMTEPLTEREIEVLRLVASGKSNKEVAQELVISVGTVKTHTNNLYRKLEARNRTDAVARARRHGLL